MTIKKIREISKLNNDFLKKRRKLNRNFLIRRKKIIDKLKRRKK